jgi:amino acid adenylation domain-containing protein
MNDISSEPRSICLHHLIEMQAVASPDRVAWVHGSDHLSWGDLDRRANRLAHRLCQLGVGPEVTVGVFLQRSLPLLVALLAIHKAGGAYIPLDPDYPAERLAFTLEDSGVKVLLTESKLLPLLAKGDLETILVDAPWEPLADAADGSPDAQVSADSLAYLIYTSGSTGRPKGVAIRHGSAVAFMRWAAATFSPAEADGVLFSTSVCFDVSVFELFLPAVLGTTGIIIPHALGLLDLPGAERVTLLSTAPSAMTELVRLNAIPRSASTVCLAGEALPARLAEDLYRIPTVQSVWNLYGPTEDTVYSTYYRVPREVSGPPPIGRPLTGGYVPLLDAELQPVAAGERGEIFLGGVGLARGYFGRPDLTAERFVPDPGAADPGARLYRTGDMGRVRADGEIEYLGRIDHQVKIRGIRIEPREIELTLTRHPAVSEAAVVVQTWRTGPQLVAFYVLREGQTLRPDALRALVRDELPSYMNPSRFIALERLPLTPNSKVDRQSLAAMSLGEEESGAVAPRTRLELELRQMWEEILQVTPIGVTDNFFALGGHSLLAIYLMAAIRERYGRSLLPPMLLQTPTIEQLAKVIEQESPRLVHPCLVPLHAQGSKPPFFCVHGAGGNIFRLVDLARTLGEVDPQRPFWGIQAKGLMGEDEPLESVAEMAEHYIGAIRSIQPKGPYHLGGYSMGGVVAYEMALQLHDSGDGVGLLAMLDAAPRPAARLPRLDVARMTMVFARELLIPIDPQELAGLSPDQALAQVLEKGVRLRRVPLELSLGDARRYLRLLETTVEASRNYVPERPYPGVMTVFEGPVLSEGLEGRWDDLTPQRQTIPIIGDHRTMLEPPFVEVLAGLLRDTLDQADAGIA